LRSNLKENTSITIQSNAGLLIEDDQNNNQKREASVPLWLQNIDSIKKEILKIEKKN